MVARHADAGSGCTTLSPSSTGEGSHKSAEVFRLNRKRSECIAHCRWAEAAFWLLALALSSLSSGVAEAKKKLPPPPADLPGHVNYLAQQLPGVMLEDATPITDEIQKLVLGDLQTWMADREPSDVEVRREMEMAFSELHYPLFGQPAAFARPWKGQVVIGAGYTLGWNDNDRTNVVAVFSSRLGHSRFVTVTNFVPHTDLHYAFIQEPEGDALRFFVYGFRLGKSQPRLTAILYSFDGQNLKNLWEADDVYDGKIEFEKDRVVIRYLKEDEYVHEQAERRKPPRHQTIYAITPGGLEVQSEEEIPF